MSRADRQVDYKREIKNNKIILEERKIIEDTPFLRRCEEFCIYLFISCFDIF